MRPNILSLEHKLPSEEARRRLRFAAEGLEIVPNPPRAGEAATVHLFLCNEEPQPLTVRTITPRIYYFGIGACQYESLPERGPLTLPPDPTHVETLTWHWLPRSAGHRCLRIHLDIEGWEQPWIVGRNLRVIRATAEAYRWQIPFHLSNPTEQAQPLRLRLHTQSADLSERTRRVWIELPGKSGILSSGQALWLQPREEHEALLVIRAHRFATEAFELVSDVEAWLGDEFLDGIRVIVQRHAPVAQPAMPDEEQTTDSPLLVSQPAGAESWRV
uniref:Uncharacterized protein n=1 Tax=Thermogemmatispora argillosa TaxID=2045280 RepID=A0A455T6K1_9CHLR|nr:hypothetical protein KTA_34480 [Thermogemmatispora argillosa]